MAYPSDVAAGQTGHVTDHNAMRDDIKASLARSAGLVALDSFTGASDDAKLTAALSYAAAQTLVPAVMLGGRAYTFTTTQPTFSGMKIVGLPTVGWQNVELSSGKSNPTKVTLNLGSGNSSWLVGSATNNDGYVANLAFVSTNQATQFQHHPLAAGTANGWAWDNLDFQGFKNVLGNATDPLSATLCSTSGRWNITSPIDTQISLRGSDCDFWTDGCCNIGAAGAPNFPGNGKYLAIFSSLGKSNVGGMYFTADDKWRAIQVSGTTQFGPGLRISGMRIEGRNTTTPSSGALVRVESGSVFFRDCWIAYGMSSPTDYTDAVDQGLVHVAGGVCRLDGITTDRASTVSEATSVLMYVATGAVGSIANVDTSTKGGTWTNPPRVQQATTGALRVDDTVTLVTG